MTQARRNFRAHRFLFRPGLSGLVAVLALLAGMAVLAPAAFAQGDNASPIIMPKPNLGLPFFNNSGARERRRQRIEQEIQRQREIERIQRESVERAAPRVDPKEVLAGQGARPSGPHDSYLVIGDALAAQLAEGLADIHAEEKGIWIDDRAVGNSGLVREDAHDWPEALKAILAEEDPKVIFVMLGLNDRQPITTDSGTYENINSPEWQASYIARVDDLLKVLVAERAPVIWVGLPPVASQDISQDYTRFNEIFRQRVESAGFFFVDIWDGFADASGQYAAQGPNVNGEIVTLRTDDGINFRNQGKRKLAFFADRLRRRLMGSGTAQLSGLTPLESGGAGRRRVVLTGLASRGGTILSGGPEATIPSPFETQERGNSLASEVLDRKPL